jgi:hypothetical protein
VSIFSYKKAIESQVESAIFARGVRDFLEGKVLTHQSLILDYWRIYKVLGKYEYELKVPLLHLALSKSKFDLAGKALLEIATCSCENFIQVGYCRHLVAVCSSLDNEFNLDWQQKNQANKKDNQEFLDNIFSVENGKLFREFEVKMDGYVLQGKTKNSPAIENLAMQIGQNEDDFASYLKSYHKNVSYFLDNWEAQKRLVGLIPRFLMYGKKIWWDFYKFHFVQINLELSYNLYAEIWELFTLKFCQEYEKELLEFFQAMHDTGKAAILDLLQAKFKLNKQIWLDFVIFSNYQTWIEQNLDYLDPLFLIKLAGQNPPMADEIEIHLLKQIKVWSDFMVSGSEEEYSEIIQVFEKWEENIGRTEKYEEALEYLQKSHPKKRKLLKTIK